MDTDEDYYSILGVSKDATQDEIKNAFKQKAKEYHPDQSDDPDAEKKFKKISEAYDVLGDEQQRERYDRYGKEGVEQNRRRGRGRSRSDLNDLIEEMFGAGLEDLLRGAARGGQRRGGQRQRRGADLKGDIVVDFETAVRGGTQDVTLTKPEPCRECGGRGATTTDPSPCGTCRGQGVVVTGQGFMQQRQRCPDCEGSGIAAADRCSNCNGRGAVNEETTMEVDVPAGVSTGDHLTLDGEGQPVPGGQNGRLVLEVTVQPHGRFERDGRDLIVEKTIGFDQAALGDRVEVERLNGQTETVTVEAGTQHGDRTRVKNAGAGPDGQRGDLVVEFRVQTPTDLNDEQTEALRDFAEASGSDLNTQLSVQNSLYSMVLSWLVFLGLYDPPQKRMSAQNGSH